MRQERSSCLIVIFTGMMDVAGASEIPGRDHPASLLFLQA